MTVTDKALRILAAVMLFAGLLPRPYGYFIVLRIVVCGICAWSAYRATQAGSTGWAWALGAIAVIFNPIVTVHLPRAAWAAIDLVAAVVVLASLRSPARLSHTK